MLSNPASRRVCTARRTSSGVARRSSTSSSAGRNDCAPTETRLTPRSRRSAASQGSRLGVRLDRHLVRRRQLLEDECERVRLGERRRSAAHEHGFHPGMKPRARAPARPRARRRRRGARRSGRRPSRSRSSRSGGRRTAGGRRGVERRHRRLRCARLRVIGPRATPATPYFFFSPSRLSTARNADCGTSTPPTCFIRRLPAFCFSSSLRLRVMSPP